LPVHFEDVRRDEAAALISTALARGEDWLKPEETAALFACYGLPLIEQRIASSPEDAGAIAGEWNCEVALKAIASGVIHKGELGAVRLQLHGSDQVSQTAREMAVRLTKAGHTPTGFLVQRMAQPGV
jgi:acyl-CoA synthetase (NDP forming)